MSLYKNSYLPVFTTAIVKILRSRGITPSRIPFVERVSNGKWIARHLVKGDQPHPDEVFTVSADGKWNWKAAQNS